MTINYQFSPIPSDFIKKIFKTNLKGNEHKVIHFLTWKIYQWEKGRDTKTGQFSLRYIGEGTGIRWQNVWTALKGLVKKGLILIIKKGVKGEGSLIKLITNPIEKVINTSTNQKPDLNIKNQILDSFKKAESELLKRGFTSPSLIIDRIWNYIDNKNNIKNPLGYFWRAINREPLPIKCVNPQSTKEYIKNLESNQREQETIELSTKTREKIIRVIKRENPKIWEWAFAWEKERLIKEYIEKNNLKSF